MRGSDYPLPSYAGYCWFGRGRLFLQRAGQQPLMFEDTPDGLNEFREALRACAPQRELIGLGSSGSGSNFSALPARVKKTANGRAKLAAADLWGEREVSAGLDAAITEELERPLASIMKEGG
jgi:hypothetical protein